MIYLDNAATTKQKPKEVIDAVIFAMQNFGNSSRGVYEESLCADRIVFETRKKIAKLFNAKNAKQVAFTKNATEALNIAIKGLFSKNDHIITSVTEHNSVLRPLNYLKEEGLDVSYLEIDEVANIKIDEIENFINKNTKAVILTHASNVTGNITDIKKVGEICKKNNLIFILDASQTAGAFDIDMQSMNIDVICFTGHKSLYAPQGTGGIVVSENVHIKPFIVGGSGTHSYDDFHPQKMPSLLEAGTLNSHCIAGLNASLDYIFKNKEYITKKAVDLSNIFYLEMKKIEGIEIYGCFDNTKSPIVSLNIFDKDSSIVSDILASKYNIATRPGAHCAPLMHKSLGTVNQGAVRFSFSHTNTIEEVEFTINAIKEIHKEFLK